MAQIKSRKHNRNAQLVALAASLPLMAHAANTQDVTQLPTITVKSDAENKYKADKLSSPKYTQPLVDTPQTVSVIKKELLKEQGATSLVEALRNTPGITLQLGENGNTSAGDAFQMRGFSTQTSTYIDGIRDLGAVTRDVFNLEQIEVVKGPSGAEAGRGSASGYINLASKLPQTENSREVSATYNTAEHARLTADINQVINSGTAFRLNAMGQDGGVEGRDYIENNSWAIAPSISFGLDSDTRLHLYSQHVRQRNIPDGGIPTVGMKGFYNADSALSSAPKVNRENYYGHVDDHEDVDADMFTAKIESDLADNLKLTNITRLGKTSMNRVLTGINTGSTGLRTNGSTDPKDWEVNRSRQGVDQENKILANQSTLNLNLKTGAIEHDLVAGLELLKEQQHTKTLATQMPGETTVATPWANLYHPDRNQAMPGLMYNGGYSNGETDTAAAYLFDTLKFGERFQLNGGVRVDYYDTEYDGLAIPRNENALVASSFAAHDTLVSWKLGGLFKPTPFSSVYASYAKSLTPPGSANFTLSETGANSSAAEPQETHHYEIGTKWDLLEGKLALNAAAYRTENENQFTIDPITQLSVQEGKKRVDGVELSAVGQITDVWNVSAGVAHMKVKQLNQQTATATTLAERWSPEWTASLWSTYDVAGFKLGLGARYVDDQKRVITDSTAAANMPGIPGYVVFDAMAGYTLNKNASVNLNVYNLADKEYISTLNNGGGRVVLGQPRSAALTFNYKF
ncbi:catecholate siderophore receptor Fiu [Acinetobacter terrestris]|uniref:catecholate siderophore receptor Fiu n=1 Tax=Acinetobacter terrestris TaxID=2529843 RepID=UPI00352401BB